MRLLLLNYEYPPLGGGGGVVSQALARYLAGNNVAVDIVTMGFRGLPAFEQVTETLRIFRTLPCRKKKELSNPFEQLVYLLFGYRLCRRLLRAHRYDCCHVHFILPTGVLAFLLRKRYGLGYVLTAHGSDVLRHNPRFRALYPLLTMPWRRIVRGAAAVTAPSEFLKAKILAQSPESRIDIIPNGIDPGAFAPRTKERLILAAGRLFVNKGFQDLLDALTGLDLQGWRVVIAGEGPFRSQLERKIRENGLTGYVTLSGWIGKETGALQDLYGRASIFVAPSYFESFNLTVLEALASGCSLLVSDIPAHREVALDHARFFKPGDIPALKAGIEAFLQEGAPLPDLREATIARFGWPAIGARYRELLEEIAGASDTPAPTNLPKSSPEIRP